MLDNGLLATCDSITKGIARMQQKITDLQTQLRSETNVRAKKQIRKMLGKQKAKLKDAEDLLALDYNPQFRGTYFPRYFNVDAIANNLDEFKSILRTWYTNNPIGTQTAESIEKSVEETVNKILSAYFMGSITRQVPDSEQFLDFTYNRPGQDVRYAISCAPLKNLGWSSQINFDEEIVELVQHYKKEFRW